MGYSRGLLCSVLIALAIGCGDDGSSGPSAPTTTPPAPTTPPVPTPPPPSTSGCRIGQILGPGQSCDFNGSTFEVLEGGCARISSLGSGRLCSQSITYNAFRATRVNATDFRIDSLPGSAPPPPPSSDACRLGDELNPGESCRIPGFRYSPFEVRADGRGCLTGSGTICAGNSLNINGFRAARISGTSRWRIDALP